MASTSLLTRSANQIIREIENELVCPGERPRRAFSYLTCRGKTRIYTPRASRLLLPLIPALFSALIFVVIQGGSRRTSLSLHAKFPGLVNLVVIYKDAP